MRVKRYVASTIQEAIAQVKYDLGRDAIILHTKPFRQGGFLGLFAKRMVEVIAAIDPQSSNKINEQKNNTTTVASSSSIANAAKKTEGKIAGELSPEILNLKEELSEVKNMVTEISVKINNTVTGAESFNNTGEELWRKKIKDFFIRQELSSSFNDDFWRGDMGTAVKGGIRVNLSGYLSKQSLCGPDLYGLPKGQIITLIGPTGVGKTTTLAKIAANAAIFEKKNISLITIDTYRIAAVEQLKTFGEIIGLPVEVVYNPQEFVKALANNQDKDLILVDTAGRSQNNKMHLEELQQFLSLVTSSMNILVLSLVTRGEDLLHIYQQFSLVPLHGFIFTKLDETATFGSLLTLPKEANLPIFYFTNGQNVPDDIEIATGERIASLLMESFPDA